MIENASGIIKIDERREMENSAMEEEELGVVVGDEAQRLRVNLFEVRDVNGRRFLQELKKTSVNGVVGITSVAMGAGGWERNGPC